MWSLLVQAAGEQVEQAAGEDPEKLRRLRVLLAYLHSHYREKITLEDAARQVGLCKSECCRFFKRQMGMPLFDYLLDYRVGKSLELLQQGKTVAESGAGAGFTSTVERCVCSGRGQAGPPSEYRRENRENVGREQHGTD